ncbi:methyltransferase domain-containing protein [Candidatus Woesearchaeota archaeon]|nr:methyltransferase domain-containing protein [Candidatus Woesearchaeota archaeon]
MNWLKKAYHIVFKQWGQIVEKELKECENILDVGCGANSQIQFFKIKRYTVGIDIDKKSLEKSRDKKIHNKYIHKNILEINKIFSPKSFDAVIALDVIEHLKKEQGFQLIKKMEKIAKKKTIIFTPNGFLAQEAYDNNKHQEHLSGWEIEELKERGYKVIGANGLKFLKTTRGLTKYRPARFWQVIGDITQLFVKNHPKYAFQLVAVKKLK